MAKDFAKPFYKSKAWQDCRAGYIKVVGGLCEDCLAKGIYTPGKVVHHRCHITPENITDPTVTLNWDNLKLVCQDCHAKEHKDVSGRYWFDDSGRIVPR